MIKRKNALSFKQVVTMPIDDLLYLAVMDMGLIRAETRLPYKLSIGEKVLPVKFSHCHTWAKDEGQVNVYHDGIIFLIDSDFKFFSKEEQKEYLKEKFQESKIIEKGSMDYGNKYEHCIFKVK